MDHRTLIAGCGDLGNALGTQLASEGLKIWGLRRRPEEIRGPIQPLAADLCQAASLKLALAGRSFEFVVLCAAAGRGDQRHYRQLYVEGLRNLVQALTAAPRRFFLVSSTRIYHQQDGSVVDEDSPTEPSSAGGRILLEAEKLAQQAGFPATVLRLAGIYGPGRKALMKKVLDGDYGKTASSPYGNRIHRDDAAGALAHLLRLERTGKKLQSCYLGVDCQPVPQEEVRRWMARQMGLPVAGNLPPPKGAGGKRCSNQRLVDSGYLFRFPSYREGYPALIQDLLTHQGNSSPS